MSECEVQNESLLGYNSLSKRVLGNSPGLIDKWWHGVTELRNFHDYIKVLSQLRLLNTSSHSGNMWRDWFTTDFRTVFPHSADPAFHCLVCKYKHSTFITGLFSIVGSLQILKDTGSTRPHCVTWRTPEFHSDGRSRSGDVKSFWCKYARTIFVSSEEVVTYSRGFKNI